MCTVIMHQSIEIPTPQVPGKGEGFDIDPGQKASIPPPPEGEIEIKCPYPWGKKFKTIQHLLWENDHFFKCSTLGWWSLHFSYWFNANLTHIFLFNY